jgi:hypothetical protein
MSDDRLLSKVHPTLSVNGSNGTSNGSSSTVATPVPDAAPAGAANEDAATERPAGANVDAAAAEVDDTDFLERLAHAMQETAGAERSRIGTDIDRRRAAHVAAIQAKRESEAARMRELAADDRKAIEDWAEAERRRVQIERDRRISELEADLRSSLREHGQAIDGQVERVEAAVAAHRTEVEAFFASLETETDPVRFAQLAGQRPVFPDLDEAAKEPESHSPVTAASVVEPAPAPAPTAEPAPVGAAEPIASPVVAPAPTADPAPVAAAEPVAIAEAATAEAAGSGAPSADSSDVEPEAVPVMDPIARLGLLTSSPADADPVEEPVVAPLAGAYRPSAEIVSPITEKTAGRPTDAATDDEAEKTPVAAASSSLNPMSWLRRKDDSSDK